MDVIIETVAKCSEEYDDGVHIQVYQSFNFLLLIYYEFINLLQIYYF